LTPCPTATRPPFASRESLDRLRFSPLFPIPLARGFRHLTLPRCRVHSRLARSIVMPHRDPAPKNVMPTHFDPVQSTLGRRSNGGACGLGGLITLSSARCRGPRLGTVCLRRLPHRQQAPRSPSSRHLQHQKRVVSPLHLAVALSGRANQAVRDRQRRASPFWALAPATPRTDQQGQRAAHARPSQRPSQRRSLSAARCPCHQNAVSVAPRARE
jgi:hypothetical protein